MTAKSASLARITNYMKLPSTTAGTARRPRSTATNWRKHAPGVGSTAIAGGMKTATAGAPIATGTTTITTATKPFLD